MACKPPMRIVLLISPELFEDTDAKNQAALIQLLGREAYDAGVAILAKERGE